MPYFSYGLTKRTGISRVFLVSRDMTTLENTTQHRKLCYRFTRLPLGLTCSPFLLPVSLRELDIMHKGRFPAAAALVHSSTFMEETTPANNFKILRSLRSHVNSLNHMEADFPRLV